MRAVAFGLVMLTGLGCASARLVSVDTEGGVVAVPSRSGRHLRKAAEVMASESPNGYTIVKEGETVAGPPVERVQTETRGTSNLQTLQTTTLEEHKEWWIWFKKN